MSKAEETAVYWHERALKAEAERDEQTEAATENYEIAKRACNDRDLWERRCAAVKGNGPALLQRAEKAERELEASIAMLDRHQARAFALRTAVDVALTAYLKP